MKIYVISLERAVERRQTIERDLQNLGLNYEIVNAVDGSMLSDQEIKKYCDLEFINLHKDWFSKGIIGACLSHYKVYQKIINDNQGQALVLEDDAKLGLSVGEILDYYDNYPKNNGITFLYYQSSRNTTIQLSSFETKSISSSFTEHKPICLTGLVSAAAYIIGNSSCRHLISNIVPIKQGADNWHKFHELGCFKEVSVVYPRPISTYDFRSTLSNIGSVKSSFLSRVVEFIDKNELPLFNQIFKLRRKWFKLKSSNIQIVKTKTILEKTRR